MPEIKNQFTGGKMNKDLDERLIPSGEYRDAMNIQVSTSEGSDVGAVQNILGNSEVYGTGVISSTAICVGAIADEKNDKLYWFIQDTSNGFDGIFEYTSPPAINAGVVPVLLDTNIGTSDAVLKFNPDKIITGINIIDDMLFWTDNQNEPRKINITRSKEGSDGNPHTKFINKETLEEWPIREEHITVIKKAPKSPPVVKLKSERANDEGMIYTGTMRITDMPLDADGDGPVATTLTGVGFGQQIPTTWNAFNDSSMWFPQSPNNHLYDFSKLSVGDYFDTHIETDINGESGFTLDWEVGDTLLFEAFGGELYDQAPDIPLRNYSLKARIRDKYHYIRNYFYMQINDCISGSEWGWNTCVGGVGTAAQQDVPHTLASNQPKTYEATWEQGASDNSIRLIGLNGFDGRIGEFHVYPIIDGVPRTDIELCPNPYFQEKDVDGSLTGTVNTPLTQWKEVNNHCKAHGSGEDPGIRKSKNPNWVDPDQPGVVFPDVVIDPAKFPCFPTDYRFNSIRSDNPQYIEEGPWHVKHTDTASSVFTSPIAWTVPPYKPLYGFAHHGGRGIYDQIGGGFAQGSTNYGGLIVSAAGNHIKFGRANGSSQDPNATGNKHGFYNWEYFANNLDSDDPSYTNLPTDNPPGLGLPGTGAADGQVYDSTYSIMNQNGDIMIPMNTAVNAIGEPLKCQNLDMTDVTHGIDSDGEPWVVPNSYTDDIGCFGRGRKFQMVYTILDSGHNYGNMNGVIQVGSPGMVDPWIKPNYFEDQPKELIRNGDFIEPDGNGNMPKHWTGSSVPQDAFTYSPGNHYVDIGKGSEKFLFPGELNTGIPLKIEEDQTYEVSFELSDIGVDSEGLKVVLAGESLTYTWETPVVGLPGEEGIHTYTIITDSSNTVQSNLDSGNRVFFAAGNSSDTEGFIGRVHNISVKRAEAPNANVTCEVLAIHNPPTAPEGGEITFAVDLEPVRNKIYEFKFPRFAYRYQYGDNEYSAMSPFSQVAFVPGDFRYHPKEGFNLAMSNRMIAANIKGFMVGIPNGVIAIDILYKDDKSPNIYIVDTIKPKHARYLAGNELETIWEKDEYTISSEQVNSMLTSNQLLRPWDAVPLRALAQDVTGSRIVYGNYTQGFNLQYEVPVDGGDSITKKYYPDFNLDILSRENLSLTSEKSIKSLREYQLGIVFADKYGRETPVISNTSGTKALEKPEGKYINQLQVGFANPYFPQNMKYFKFFVKETSNEYYNLAMDRWYDAEDGGAWLAFPSSDRNKVDIDTFLILKKATDSNVGIVDETKYKILDIQSNAPSFIKQKKTLISTTKHVANVDDGIFGTDLLDAPRVGEADFKMNYKPFHDSSGSNLDEIKDGNLWVDFESLGGSVTKRYRISKITNDYSPLVAAGGEEIELDAAQYSVILTEDFGSDIDLITDDPLTGLSPTKINDGTVINIYKYTEEDQAKFDGRFFAKISVDLAFFSSIISGTGSGKYRRVSGKKLYYLSPDNSALHDSSLTGQSKGLYDSTNGDFGRFAPFFRNYNKPENFIAETIGSTTTYGYEPYTGTTNVPVGQYAFGPDSDTDRPWLQELAYYTTAPTVDGFKRNTSSGNVASAPHPRVADSHGWGTPITQSGQIIPKPRGGVFNKSNEQTHGSVWFIDGGPFYGENALESGDNLHWADGETRLVNPVSPGLSDGIEESENAAYFNIAVGGIYNEKIDVGGGGEIKSFFDLRSGANTNYGENTQEVVERISPGQKFRFREDPNGDIYTIQANVGNQRRVRWSTIEKSLDTSLTVTDYAWDFNALKDSDGSSTSTWYHTLPKDADATDPNDDYTIFGTQLSPNFTRGWRPRVLNSAGESEVHWNPATGVLSPIENGLKLSIIHSSEDADDVSPNVYVNVDSLEGTDVNTGLKHNVAVGMIMISHSDGNTEYEAPSTTGLEYLAIKEIEDLGVNLGYKLHLTGYSKILVSTSNANTATLGLTVHTIFTSATAPATDGEMIFAQPTMNGYSQYSVNRINAQDPADQGWDGPTFDADTGEQTDSGNPGIMAIGYNLDFLEEIGLDSDSQIVVSENPAVWETEPKESVDLDLYHEASGYYPLEVKDNDTALLLIPYGSIVETIQADGYIEPGTTVVGTVLDGVDDLKITLHSPSDPLNYIDPDTTPLPVVGTLVSENWSTGDLGPYIRKYDRLRITKPNGEIIVVTIKGWPTVIDGNANPDANGRTTQFILDGELIGGKTSYILNWHNCYSFGNGVESNRVRDNFNLPFISNGPKVSTIWEGDYSSEHRKYGLIYSGLYNSNSGVNNLNQFIAAEKITKDINPIYGSIQKLHSRDTDLVTLCEDKCLRILANKDAVFNADGNPNLVATSNVLGQTIPFSGEFGISTNPESFASESYRAYFTDKVRGVVMRLSKDGLTPISMYGMEDWFKDNLRLSSKLIGSYDDRKDEYNITLKGMVNFGYIDTTVSFKEDVKGWVSFKSFIPEFGISMASNYYTMKHGALYMHHDENVDRNTFYNEDLVNSSINVVFNENPGIVKTFHTLNYEGSQSKIDKFSNVLFQNTDEYAMMEDPTNYNDQEYYNLSAKPGWYAESIITNKDEGYVNNFIEKEGKWFNNINKLIDPDQQVADTDNFSFQGIGEPTDYGDLGCTDPEASNYNPNALVDDGSCLYDECITINQVTFADLENGLEGVYFKIDCDCGSGKGAQPLHRVGVPDPRCWYVGVRIPGFGGGDSFKYEITRDDDGTSIYESDWLGAANEPHFDGDVSALLTEETSYTLTLVYLETGTDDKCDYTFTSYLGDCTQVSTPGCTYCENEPGNSLSLPVWTSVIGDGGANTAMAWEDLYFKSGPGFEAFNCDPAATEEDGSCIWHLKACSTPGDPNYDSRCTHPLFSPYFVCDDANYCSNTTGYCHIPDANFRTALDSATTQNGDPYNVTWLNNDINSEYVLISDINTIEYLKMTSAGISDLTGIECFVNVTRLNISGNQLTSIDVSTNTALTHLDCNSNQLTSLDVSNNTALTNLYCGKNQLTSLDVSNNTNLIGFNCMHNQITSINVSNNTVLETLSVEYNQLTSLDVSNNTALTSLHCMHNQITSLDVSNNSSLTHLSCNDNNLIYLNIQNGNNINFTNQFSFKARHNDLLCITVDNVAYMVSNFPNSIDGNQLGPTYYSTSC